MNSILQRLISDNEQDRAECEQWFRETPDSVKIAFWMKVLQKHYDDPVMEVMSRFAALAFAEMWERLSQGEQSL